MNSSVPTIPLFDLAPVVVPVIIVAAIYYRWTMGGGKIFHAFFRMMIQLILIGYVLNYLFAWNNPATVSLMFVVMLLASAWIALHPIEHKSARLYGKMLLAISVGGITTLMFFTQVVLKLDPWFSVKYMIPLGGMTFSSAMNTVCLAAERFESEIRKGGSYEAIRNTSLQASMIPTINMLLAVGLVALPGVMTGQILSGVPPLVAVRYQVVIMCLVLGAAGISTALYLVLMRSAVPAGAEREPSSP